MMKIFRGKFLALLKTEFTPDQLPFLKNLYQTDWVLHCCKPYKDGASVAGYIARYMRGGALKNGQLIGAKERIAFSYKSHQTGKRERLALLPNDFIKRLLQHVPLKGKPTVRCYGLYHPTKELSLNEARDQLGQEWITYPIEFDWAGWLKDTQPKECAICVEKAEKFKTK
jgi:hypothetical protein